MLHINCNEIKRNNILLLKGISENTTPTMGSIKTIIFLTSSHTMLHELFIVDENFPIETDMLLGTDFLIKANAIIDLEKKGILLHGKIWLPFQQLEPHILTKHNNLLNFFKSNELYDTFREDLTSSLDEQYHEHLMEYGFPVPLLSNPLVRILVMTKHTNQEISPSIKLYSENSLSRQDKILRQTKITTVNQTEITTMENIIREFSDIFHLEGEKLSCTDALEFTIPIKPDTGPINIRQYRLSPGQQVEVKKQVNELLENDIIRHSNSQWSAPIVLVPKKSEVPGEKLFRLVLDYRKLNENIIRDSYPLPLIADILDSISGSKYFSKLDLQSGFHQIKIRESDKCKTAFRTPEGLFEFNNLPFGINSAPACFARLMAFVLREHLEKKICFVYIDDVLILGENQGKHMENIISIFNTLRQNNLSLKPSKCEFMSGKIIYLGFQITEFGVSPNPDKVIALQNLEVKKTIRGIRGFLGAMSYYRKHTQNFADIAKPLTNLLKTKEKFVWNNDCTLAVEKLKSNLIRDCLLKGPDFSRGFILATDASCHSIGSALSQLSDENIEEPIGFYSRTMTAPELNYTVSEKEMLSVICSVQHFRCYLIGAKIKTKIITDHQPLKFLLTLKQTSSRLIRWAIKLEEFNYEIIYRPGKTNFVADALSRTKPTASVNVITRAQAKKGQVAAPIIPSDPQQPQIAVDPISSDDEDQTDLNDTLSDQLDSRAVHTVPSGSNDNILINLNDEDEVFEIIKLHHDSPIGGHFGFNKTFNRIRQYYTWPKMSTDIKLYVKNCPICQKVKAQGVTKAPMVIVTTAKSSWEKISIDLVGPLSETVKANKYLLTVEDHLSKWLIAIPLPNQEAQTVAEALVQEVFLIYGAPLSLLSDQGTNFMSKLFAALCKFWKVKQHRSSPYHAQTNGILERSHFYLKNYLRAFTNHSQDNWDDWVRHATFAFNTTPHTATKMSPYELLFGRKPNLPAGMSGTPEILYNYDNYLADLKHKLQNASKIAQDNLKLAKLRSKKYYDKNTVIITYNVGDLVLLKTSHSKIGRPLFEKWSGPYVVTEVPSMEGTIIKIKNNNRRYHNNLLKPYNTAV